MKNLKITLTAIFLIAGIVSIAQAPQAFNYQTVVRDGDGNALQNQDVSLRFSIRDGSPGGAILFREYHNVLTNTYGLVNLEIGNGILVSGSISNIDWGSGTKFLQTELDATGGSSYISMGTSEMHSVPYALYAENTGGQVWSQDGSVVYYNTGRVGIGTDSPGADLDVFGHIWQSGTGNSVFIGEDAGKQDDLNDNNNTYIGVAAGRDNVSGNNNVAIGYYAGYGNELGSNNIYIGANANSMSNVDSDLLNIGNTIFANLSNQQVGIGTWSPLVNLDIRDDDGFAIISLQSNSGSSILRLDKQNPTNAAYINFRTNATDQWAVGTIGDEGFSISKSWSAADGTMYVAPSGNVGIGTTSPGAKLDVAGHIWQTETGGSVFIGENAGALDDLTDNGNVFIGYSAGQNNSTGFSNVSLGAYALNGNTEGVQNTAIGNSSLATNVAGDYNTAIGNSSLNANTSGSSNSAFGMGALKSNLGGNGNTATGFYAMFNNTSGINNIAMGYNALYNNLTGTGNTSLGYGALQNSTGHYNIAIGYVAGNNLSSGSNNILIGCDAPNPSGSNQLYIGEVLYGDLSSGNIGIGTTNPNAPLSFGWEEGNKILLYDAGVYKSGFGVGEDGMQIFSSQINKSNILFGECDYTTGEFIENIRINYNGYLGIGTSDPKASLSFGESIGTVIHYYENDGVEMGMFSSSNGLLLFSAEQLSGGVSIGSKNAANSITTHARFNNDGKVGIGTTNPSAGLHIKGAQFPNSFLYIESGANQDAGIRLYEGATDKWHIFNNETSNGLQIYNTAGKTVFFAQQSSGNVGIGTTLPEHTLHVNGSELLASGPTGGFKFRDRASSTVIDDWVWYALNDAAYFYKSGLGNIWTVANDGKLGLRRTPTANMLEVQGSASKSTAGSWLANSDKRIKTDISGIDNASQLLMELHPVKFKYTAEWKNQHPEIKDHYYYNFIAQEFQQVFPNAVQGSGEYIEGDQNEILQIDTYNAQIVTIKAVQEIIEENRNQAELIQSQQQLLETLQMEVEKLKALVGGFAEK